MNDQIREGIYGGFGGALRSQMSPQLLRAIAEQEAEERRQAAQEERARAQRREDFEAANVQSAIAEALASGQEFSPRMLRGQGYGRTRSEAIAHYSAMQDLEDRRAEVREAKEFENWKIQRSASLSGDSSADVVQAERAEEQWRQDQRARNQVARGRAIRRDQIVQEARKAALGDTAKIAAGLAQAVARDRRGY